MTKINRRKYITDLLSANDIWSIPTTGLFGYGGHLLPTLTDAHWEHAFEDATTHQRKNLARGWIWSYTVKNHVQQFDSYGKAEDWCLERCANWIKKIEPYVSEEAPTDDRNEYRLMCGFLLHRSGTTSATILKTLWFGTEDEKLSMLLSMADNPVTLRMAANSLSSHNRISEMVRFPGATQQHATMAAYVAMKTGASKNGTTPAVGEHFNHWHQFGRIMVDETPTFPHECEALIKSKRFLQEQPPGVAVPALTRFVHDELHGPRRMSEDSLGNLFWKPDGRGNDNMTATPENIYIALAEWLPAHSLQWATAESLGLSVLEAGKIIAATAMASAEDVALPTDIELP
jgi:hypothetical protein